MYSCGIYESKWHVRRVRRNFINVRYLAEVLCRMFPLFPLGEILKLLINLIWLGLASTTCKTFLPGKFIPTYCFRRLLFFDFFGITIVPTRGLFIVLLLWCLYHISSGRMGLTTYPKGGRAPEQLVVLMIIWYLPPYIIVTTMVTVWGVQWVILKHNFPL